MRCLETPGLKHATKDKLQEINPTLLKDKFTSTKLQIAHDHVSLRNPNSVFPPKHSNHKIPTQKSKL